MKVPTREKIRLVLIGIFFELFLGLPLCWKGFWMIYKDVKVPWGIFFLLLGLSACVMTVAYIIHTVKQFHRGFPRKDERTRNLVQRSAAKAFFIALYLEIILIFFKSDYREIEPSLLVFYQILMMLCIFGLCWTWHHFRGESTE